VANPSVTASTQDGKRCSRHGLGKIEKLFRKDDAREAQGKMERQEEKHFRLSTLTCAVGGGEGRGFVINAGINNLETSRSKGA
jgi:hypothetical protein